VSSVAEEDRVTLDDVAKIRRSADELVALSAKLHTPQDKIGTDYHQGIQAHRRVADEARVVADKLERRMTV
jgi:hypothetical protein